MLNQVILVGRVVEITTLKTKTKMLLEVKKSYMNKFGEYESDVITIEFSKHFLNKIESVTHVTKGDLIGIKGVLQSDNKNKSIVIVNTVNVLSKGGEL